MVQQMREGEEKTRDDLQEIRAEVHNVREMLPKVGLVSCCLKPIVS